MNVALGDAPTVRAGTVVDLTVRVASDEELRRRAAEGDQAAIAEQRRREGERRQSGSRAGAGRKLEIVTEPGHGTGREDWVVRGEWHGARRVLFIGNVFECSRWARSQERAAA